MKGERIKRYNEKLEKLNQIIGNLNDWTAEIDETGFNNNIELIKKYGIYHAFQIGVEIVVDVSAMIVKDVKMIPKDDYANIDILKEKQILTADLAKKLREANGLRNRIAHDYNGLDNGIAYTRIIEFIKELKNFKEEITIWLKKV